MSNSRTLRLAIVGRQALWPVDLVRTLAELTDFLRRERRIAPQKLPEMLQVVDALPTTMTGKVQKFLLRDQARALSEGIDAT